MKILGIQSLRFGWRGREDGEESDEIIDVFVNGDAKTS